MTTRFYDGDSSNNTYCWDGKLNVNDPEWRGDFKGLIEKLDYIKALGFTSVWITPVVENASGLDYHGYHAFNFSKVDPRYESEDCDFQDLIDAAHNRGMKIILDIVLQHTGNFGEENLCPMFVKDYSENLSNIDTSMKLHPQSGLPSNYFSLQSSQQYNSRLSLMKNVDGVNHDNHNYWHHVGNNWNWDDYSRVWGQIAGDCVDLNTENPAVTEYLVNCYGKFIEMGVDGFRIDTSGHIARLTFNNAFIPQFHELAEKYKEKRGGTPFFMFGEVCARSREVIYRNGNINCSPFYYTWTEDQNYDWDYSPISWDSYVVMEGQYGDHVNAKSVLKQAQDDAGQSNLARYDSNNSFLNGNEYHTPDYSQYSGFSVIDFPMHWNFGTTREAWSVKYGDKMYNDATYNVTYVDSHDYAPDGMEKTRFTGSQETWASNLDLMFTFRGIPCLYYGSEIEFKKGELIDNGANTALINTGRAYFGGYIEGEVEVNDFGDYVSASGNMAATLSHPLALHVQRLNKIRAAIPALRKGQYSTDGCSGGGHGGICFKRRYTDDDIDSYVLVTIGGNATFSNILPGTYIDAVTGDIKTVSSGGSLSAQCSGNANMRIYVLSTDKTPAPGKIGEDGKYLYDSSPVNISQKPYTSEVEPKDTETKRSSGSGNYEEPEEPKDLIVYKGEQCAFFHNTSSWASPIYAWVWTSSKNYTGGTWPGVACENLGNGYWKWSYNIDEQLPADTQIIFSNGSQTKDLNFVNGAVYTPGGSIEMIVEESDIENPVTPETPSVPTEEFTVYFKNSVNWNTVKVHYWGGVSSSQWPGVNMFKTEEEDVYSYTVPAGTTGLVFNNGNNGDGQTGDMIALPNHIYSKEGGDLGLYFEEPDITVAIESVINDLDEVIFFNLQGQRVNNPDKGIYIVKRGNLVTKEYVR